MCQSGVVSVWAEEQFLSAGSSWPPVCPLRQLSPSAMEAVGNLRSMTLRGRMDSTQAYNQGKRDRGRGCYVHWVLCCFVNKQTDQQMLPMAQNPSSGQLHYHKHQVQLTGAITVDQSTVPTSMGDVTEQEQHAAQNVSHLLEQHCLNNPSLLCAITMEYINNWSKAA